MAGRDITERIPMNIGNPGTSDFWVNSAEAYDIAVGGLPFLLAPTDNNPYQRETAPYRKDQFDNGKEPGEQSLTGWWIRSQSSFHAGNGIKFYDPSAGEVTDYRFADSRNVDVWTKGQVTLLKNTAYAHQTTGAVVGTDHQHRNQHIRPIQWNGTNGVLLHDEYDVDKIFPTITATITNKALTLNVATLTTAAAHNMTVGMEIVVTGVDSTFNGEYTIASVPSATTFTFAKTATDVPSTAATGTVSSNIIHFVNYLTGTADRVYAICDDGRFAYWVTNDSVGGKLQMWKKDLSLNTPSGQTMMFDYPGLTIEYATMEYVKDRIVLCVNNKVYEISPTATGLITNGGTLVYTNPKTNYHYTSVSASGPAIYTAGHSGIYSSIQKYTLASNGSMPVLQSAVVAAELPVGEVVERVFYYLGKLIIGTSKGVRVADIEETTGSILYGPLLFESSQPVYDFAARDRFVWCAAGVGELDAGLVRVDLGQNIGQEPLRFAYANDIQYPQSEEHFTTAVGFLGSSNQLAFCTAHNVTDGGIYIESATELATSGYVITGAIRYGTLEPKHFKFIRGRGDFRKGAMDIQSIAEDGSLYSIITYDKNVGSPEVSTTSPEYAQEFMSFKFTLSRETTNNQEGPTFKGYQVKALPATKGQRLIQFPVWCFDVEKDRFNVVAGYEGRAWERIQALEETESRRDVVNIQDFTVGERVQGVIEKISFIRKSPPNGDFDGFGGIIFITVRTVL